MNYDEYVNKAKEALNNNQKILQQSHIMFIPCMNKRLRDNPIGQETRVRYDINEIWNDFVYKENKVLYFIDKYLQNMISGLEHYSNVLNENGVTTMPNETLEVAAYYFDALVSSFSVIIEGDQKAALCNNFGEKQLNDFFPSRNTPGLFWEIYMLRNRVAHFTNGRYSESSNLCERYLDFSSKIFTINVDKEGDISANCTLIDINKCEAAQQAIRIAIKDKDKNPFDLLFPNIKPKGHGKKKPFILAITNDVFFNHIDSGLLLVKNIHIVLNNINELFLNKFIEDDPDVANTKATCAKGYFYGKEITYSINDVFD